MNVKPVKNMLLNIINQKIVFYPLYIFGNNEQKLVCAVRDVLVHKTIIWILKKYILY